MRIAILHAIAQRKSHLCVGMDPRTSTLPAFLKKQFRTLGVHKFLEKWGHTVIDASRAHSCAVKLQSAFFECYGHEGVRALHALLQATRKQRIFSILDAKRGDIASTMTAYGVAAFEHGGAQCLTILPTMGTDTLAALAPWFKKGRGVFTVLLSSNPSGIAMQEPQFAHTFKLFDQFARETQVQDALGWVIGAQRWDFAETWCGIDFASTPILIPGLGAQKGSLSLALKARLNFKNPLVVSVSRGITGIGDSDFSEELRSLKSWQEYGLFIESCAAHWQRALSGEASAPGS